MTVTVPQSYLDSASYPVVVDPTFGYTGGGITYGYIARKRQTTPNIRAYRRGSSFSLSGVSGNWKLDSISAYLQHSVAGSTSLALSFFLDRTDSGGADTHDRVAFCESVHSVSSTAQYYTILAPTTYLVSDDYYLSAVGNPDQLPNDGTTNHDINIFYDDSAGFSNDGSGEEWAVGDGTDYASSKENPFTPTTQFSVILSIYATYSEIPVCPWITA